jgi:hypothetical protein
MTIEIQFNSIQFNFLFYFNVLTQQLQEPITELPQEDKYNNNNNNAY